MTEDTATLAVVVVGGHRLDGLTCVTCVDDVPANVRVIVVEHVGSEAEMASLAARLRARHPHSVLLGWSRAGCDASLDALLRSGYDDVVVGEVHLRARVSCLGRMATVDSHASSMADALDALATFIDEMAERPDMKDLVRVILNRLTELLPLAYASVLLAKPGDEVAFGVVEREEGRLENLVLRMSDLPELEDVLAHREPVTVSGPGLERLLFGQTPESALPLSQRWGAGGISNDGPEPREGSFGPAMLFPLKRSGMLLGAVYVRSSVAGELGAASLRSLGRVVAAATAVAVGNAMAHDSLLDTHRALVRRQEHIDDRLASFKTFSDIFEQSHDGILVTAEDGSIRYANPAAGEMLRRRPDFLRGEPFLDLLSPLSHALARRAYRGDSVGDARGYVDLLVPDDGGAESVISAAIRPLGDRQGVLISFRDVTELREIETELRQTRDFLENLIQSSVDAIVASDVNGRMILFNRAAERIFGYAARDVLGRMELADLYAPGEARDVMRRLRADAFGGRGRLQPLRRNLVSKSGDPVPVQLTAAVIYEGDRESAIVSIFTDLRERMKIEQKLSAVEQRLRLTERQAVAIELAGTAAHELNQPLTSIMGYAELVKKRVPEDDLMGKAVRTICREAERMAAVVKRLGEITAYQTKPYVGGSQILDLSPTPGEVNDDRSVSRSSPDDAKGRRTE